MQINLDATFLNSDLFKTFLMENYSDNPVLRLSLEFSKKIIPFCNELNSQHHYEMKNQLYRSGTAVSAHIHEAQHPESRKDFIHKMKLAAKEAEESYYWLSLCENNPGYPSTDELISILVQIKKLLSTIIVTALKNLKNT